jgi:hypothetical protein
MGIPFDFASSPQIAKPTKPKPRAPSLG